MAKTFEIKCRCGERKEVDEAGIADAQRRCADCNTLPEVRAKLAYELSLPGYTPPA